MLSKRIGVIGSGAGGLQVAKCMISAGFDCIVIDKSPKVGGLWQSNYSSFGLQVPKQLYEICDFSHKVASGYFPKGAEVQTYLESYASTNDLNKHIHLQTSVEKVERNGDKGWIMSLQNASGTISKEKVDYLVVATGMYSMPNIPKFESQDFEGDIIHSSQFTDKLMASKKNVVVIGGAKSAYDIVLESQKVSTRSTLVYREVHWSTPRKIAGLIPFQWIFLSRFGQGLVSWYKGGWPGAPSSVHTTHRILKPIMGGVFSIVEALIGFQLGFKGDYRPKDDIVRDFYGYGHVVDTSYKKARQSNEIDTIKDTVKKLTKNTVILESGKEIPCDLLICATGYQKSYDMFDSKTKELLQIEKDGLYLYKHCVPVNVPDLFFIGSECATISNINTYGIQANWVKSILEGKFDLPKKDIMNKDVEDMKEWKRSWMPETSNRASLVLLHQTHYHDSLLKDMNIPHRRKGLNFISELFAPYQGGDYDGIFNKKSVEILK